jgi:hypothetical protein
MRVTLGSRAAGKGCDQRPVDGAIGLWTSGAQADAAAGVEVDDDDFDSDFAAGFESDFDVDDDSDFDEDDESDFGSEPDEESEDFAAARLSVR